MIFVLCVAVGLFGIGLLGKLLLNKWVLGILFLLLLAGGGA